MISRAHHQLGLHATRLAEDLQREVWGFAQAVIDAENQVCADNRMNYWKSRLLLSVEHAKARGMEAGEIARQCELSLSTSRGSSNFPVNSLFQIESYLRQQGVPAKLHPPLRDAGLRSSLSA
ncbi:MAG: hypothetical protein NTZ01_01880 [Verrucomicrobia bacterium]|nr:hypothetical protein [Verrucomicrobiota bacterium]